MQKYPAVSEYDDIVTAIELEEKKWPPYCKNGSMICLVANYITVSLACAKHRLFCWYVLSRSVGIADSLKQVIVTIDWWGWVGLRVVGQDLFYRSRWGLQSIAKGSPRQSDLIRRGPCLLCIPLHTYNWYHLVVDSLGLPNRNISAWDSRQG